MPIHWLPVQRCIANDTLGRNRVAPPLVLTRRNPMHLLRTREGGGSPSQGGLAHGKKQLKGERPHTPRTRARLHITSPLAGAAASTAFSLIAFITTLFTLSQLMMPKSEANSVSTSM